MKEMRKTYHAPKTRLVVPAGLQLMDGESNLPAVSGGGNPNYDTDFPVGSDEFSGDVGAKSFGGTHFE
jgi:hypothetical protein